MINENNGDLQNDNFSAEDQLHICLGSLADWLEEDLPNELTHRGVEIDIDSGLASINNSPKIDLHNLPNGFLGKFISILNRLECPLQVKVGYPIHGDYIPQIKSVPSHFNELCDSIANLADFMFLPVTVNYSNGLFSQEKISNITNQIIIQILNFIREDFTNPDLSIVPFNHSPNKVTLYVICVLPKFEKIYKV
ncbi:hypothetical protein KC669_00470 [Candidatus Dojkabacteria bacterium]|uniref:Uncharacterized protein n=1 Tax=Candidatus Dojkabacteria bacterium TaxID=2099670 RepID=A0A955RLM8_9BACT|nr:hypothetical protein [Candidatus Dojkabacteria bacterium]